MCNTNLYNKLLGYYVILIGFDFSMLITDDKINVPKLYLFVQYIKP